MKIIKIIDLLNMISKGEEVPKKIRFDNTYWNRICGEKYPYYTNDYDSDLFIYFFRKNLTFSLNDEVEIIEENPTLNDIRESYGLPRIEEHKIPEKICTNRIINTKDILEFEMIQNKINAEYTYVINKILDYLEVNND